MVTGQTVLLAQVVETLPTVNVATVLGVIAQKKPAEMVTLV